MSPSRARSSVRWNHIIHCGAQGRSQGWMVGRDALLSQQADGGLMAVVTVEGLAEPSVRRLSDEKAVHLAVAQHVLLEVSQPAVAPHALQDVPPHPVTDGGACDLQYPIDRRLRTHAAAAPGPVRLGPEYAGESVDGKRGLQDAQAHPHPTTVFACRLGQLERVSAPTGPPKRARGETTERGSHSSRELAGSSGRRRWRRT